MAKKKYNQLDPGTLTLSQLLAHANPTTGKLFRAPYSELVALVAGQTPVKTYADQTALLANTDLVIGYIAYVADSGSFYLYQGPDPDDIGNYTALFDAYTSPFPQVTATGTNTYAATAATAATAYATGQKFQIKFTNASSGVSTLNLNAVGAKKIFVNPTTQATTSHIVAGQISLLVYDAALDSATGGFLMIGAPSPAGVTPNLEDVLTEGNDAGALQLKNIADGTDPQDGVSLAQLTAAALGIVSSWKAPVKVATAVAGTLATSFENGDTVDGITLVTGDRILIKNQATQSENGIYTVNASGAPTRATDANTAAELEGVAVMVQQGTAGANTTWIQTTDGITLGSSNIVWSQMGTTVPNADASTSGIAKLYTSTGSSTDGSMDRNSITNALALKDNLPVRNDVTLANGVTTIDWAAGDIQNLTITEAKVISAISNPVVGKIIKLIIPGTNSLTFSTISAVVEGTYAAGVQNVIYIECLKVSGGAEYRITYDSNLSPYPFSAVTSSTNVTTWVISIQEWFANRTLTLTENSTFSISGAQNGYQGVCWVTASGADRTISIPAGATHKLMGVGDNTVKNIIIPSGATWIVFWKYDGATYRWGYIDE